ncbi:MAG: ABC transporter permease [Oscillospiraceae bacterium]|nr:ABC transporter permease [Oscillospiraceae bacterium]
MLDITTLLNAFPGYIAQGAIWGIMALGLYISYRLLEFSDLTVDGSFATGAAVTVMLIIAGWPAWAAMLAAVAAGMLAGLITGLLHTTLGIAPILAGILTQIALYSVNLHILGNKPNQAVSVDKYDLVLSLRTVNEAIIIALIFAAALIAAFYWFFGTEAGSAIRATGCNPSMAKAQGININFCKVFALSLSNGIVALAGGLLAQYQGFADVGIGRGAIVIGLASIIIGEVLAEAFFGKHMTFWLCLSSAVIGGILYYIIMGVVLWLKLPTNDMKLFTAIIVAIFLAVPYLKKNFKNSFFRLKLAEKKKAKEAAKNA